jgi:hypothetical protein
MLSFCQRIRLLERGGSVSEAKKENWIVGVALTITVLAILSIISSLKAASYTAKEQSAAVESSRWTHFQADAIKEHSFKLQMEIFELNKLSGSVSPEIQNYIEQKVKEYDEAVKRYEKESDQLKQDAENLTREDEKVKKHQENFSVAGTLLQSAIILSSIGILIRRKFMWVSGMGLATLGFAYMANGFLLWF